jgi:heptosyltransferase-2
VIHPFAGWPAKEWNLRKFIELADIVNEKTECLVVFPIERMKKDILNELDIKKIRYIETKSVTDLIETIKNCTAFIGNDSGPLHLASLLGKPTFSIYGPTNPEYHLPLTGINSYCQNIINCSPSPKEKLCFTNGGRNGCPAFECMNNLSVQEVKIKVMEFLDVVLQSKEFSNH